MRLGPYFSNPLRFGIIEKSAENLGFPYFFIKNFKINFFETQFGFDVQIWVARAIIFVLKKLLVFKRFKFLKIAYIKFKSCYLLLKSFSFRMYTTSKLC